MNQYKLIESLSMQIAMWADDNLFGHDANDEEYEELCERLSDDICGEIYETLIGRPVR